MTPSAAAKQMEDARLPGWKLSYRVDEACAATGYGKTKMWELICAGKIKARKDGRLTFILRADLQDYLDTRPAWRSARAA